MSETSSNTAKPNTLPQLMSRPYYIGWRQQICGNCEFWRKLTISGLPTIGDKNSETGHCFGSPPVLLATGSSPSIGNPGAQKQSVTVTRLTLPANYNACGLFLPANFANKLTFNSESTTDGSA